MDSMASARVESCDVVLVYTAKFGTRVIARRAWMKPAGLNVVQEWLFIGRKISQRPPRKRRLREM